MIRKIMHQIWNERKENAWIFLELLVVSICVWLAIDPQFNLISRNNVEKGYDAENVFIIDIERYKDDSRNHDTTFDGYNNKIAQEKVTQMLRQIESLPEVENYTLLMFSFPGGGATSNNFIIDSTMRTDNKRIETTIMYYAENGLENSNIFATYGIMDIRTNKIIEKDKNGNYVYISESLAKKLFDTENVVGKEIESENGNKHTVKGVFKDIQQDTHCSPCETAIFTSRADVYYSEINFSWYDLHIKVKKDTDKTEFERKFRDEIMPTLKGGNIFCHKITSHADKIKQLEKKKGITNKYRKNIILSSFALLCALLGIVGTFWVRTVARRQEIGIMQSIGATRATIVKQFVTEATILATIAFLIATPLLIQYVYMNGFAEPINIGFYVGFKPISETLAWHNKPVPHFVIVSVITYLLVTIISIVGAAIPVAATVKKEPVEALREE